jgi:hypothetical protein
MWLSLEETTLHKSQEEEDNNVTTITLTTIKNQNKSDLIQDKPKLRRI